MKYCLLPGGPRWRKVGSGRLDVYFGELSFGQFVMVTSQSAKTSGPPGGVDCVCLLNTQAILDHGITIRQSPLGAIPVDRRVPMCFAQAVANADSKEVLFLGPLLHTLDFSWGCFVRKVLLGASELAEALACDTYAQKVLVLSGCWREDLRASTAEDVFDSISKDLFDEAEKGEPQGEGRPPPNPQPRRITT